MAGNHLRKVSDLRRKNVLSFAELSYFQFTNWVIFTLQLRAERTRRDKNRTDSR